MAGGEICLIVLSACTLGLAATVVYLAVRVAGFAGSAVRHAMAISEQELAYMAMQRDEALGRAQIEVAAAGRAGVPRTRAKEPEPDLTATLDGHIA